MFEAIRGLFSKKENLPVLYNPVIAGYFGSGKKIEYSTVWVEGPSNIVEDILNLSLHGVKGTQPLYSNDRQEVQVFGTKEKDGELLFFQFPFRGAPSIYLINESSLEITDTLCELIDNVNSKITDTKIYETGNDQKQIKFESKPIVSPTFARQHSIRKHNDYFKERFSRNNWMNYSSNYFHNDLVLKGIDFR